MSEQLVCDHTSVGVIARDDQGRILLIERKNFPFGWAPPAGHLDSHGFYTACFKEFEKQTGLRVKLDCPPRSLLGCIKHNPCWRENGGYHEWRIFEVDWEDDLKPNLNETKNICWCSNSDIIILAQKTERYLRSLKFAATLQEELEISMVKIIEKEWQSSLGLEPVWYEFFQELNII